MAGMRKQTQYNWKDTNLELFGSNIERDIKKSSSDVEPAWKNAGTKPGLQIWRIVKFKVTHWPVQDYGKFYDGDSYIVLNTYAEAESASLFYDVHFWIGKYSTQDEYGTAAYKTVELDIFLNDKPIQHREVQGHESRMFKSYFKTITILRGGADSGFRKVEQKEFQPRLLHFHGDRKQVEITEIPRCRKLLDSSDVYILDMGKKIYQWNGKNSNKDEKYRAASYVHQIKQERGTCTSETLDEDILICGVFYGKLDEADDTAETEYIQSDKPVSKKLFRLSDASGKLTFKLEKEGQISKKDFDSNDVFIFDTSSDIFVWIGKSTTINEKMNAIAYAHNYMKSTDHPLLPISCIREEQISHQLQVALTA